MCAHFTTHPLTCARCDFSSCSTTRLQNSRLRISANATIVTVFMIQVQSIRGHKEVDGQVQYLVHWKKYSDDHDSWEPVANLKDCDKIIEEYEMKLKRQVGVFQNWMLYTIDMQ